MRRMKQTTLAFALVMAAAGVAQAGGSPGSIGVGAEFMNIGIGAVGGDLGGVSMNYDAGDFHVGGFLGFADGGGDNDTAFSIGGRFYYHVHSTSMADFSVGGALGIVSADAGPDDRNTYMGLDAGFQIRAFVASNVALSFAAGLGIGAIDADGIFIGGQVNGFAGVHYYFF